MNTKKNCVMQNVRRGNEKGQRTKEEKWLKIYNLYEIRLCIIFTSLHDMYKHYEKVDE